MSAKPLAWAIKYDARALQDLRKPDHSIRREILDYMEQRIAKAEDPRKLGKPLRASKFGLWRYRVRDYRVICQLQDRRLAVLVVSIGHRSAVYED